MQCSAEGNPVPSYQWRNLVNGSVIQGDVLDISEDMVNRSYSFQCTAINNYNSISSNISFTVYSMSITVNYYTDYNSLEELISGYWPPVRLLIDCNVHPLFQHCVCVTAANYDITGRSRLPQLSPLEFSFRATVLKGFNHHYRATLCVSAVFAIVRCPCVCLSVCLSRWCIVSTELTRNKSIVPCWTMHTGRMSGVSLPRMVLINIYVNNNHA